MEDIFLKTARDKEFTNSLGKTKLFVGGLPLHACDQNLAKYFRKFGPLDTIEVQRNPDGKSRGFAFIEYLRPADARKALLSGPHDILGKVVSLQIALDSNLAATMTKSRQTRKLYLSGIPPQVQESELWIALNRVGSVEKLISPRFGIQSRGFCYVIMKNVEDYQNLIQRGNVLLEFPNGEIHNLKIESAISQTFAKGQEKSVMKNPHQHKSGSGDLNGLPIGGRSKSNLNATGTSAPPTQSAIPKRSQLITQVRILKPQGTRPEGHKLRHQTQYIRPIVCSSGPSEADVFHQAAGRGPLGQIQITKQIAITDVCAFPKVLVSETNFTTSSQAQGGVFYGTPLPDFRATETPGTESNYRFNLRKN